MRIYNIDTKSPNIRYLLALKVCQCLQISSFIANLKNTKNKISELISNAQNQMVDLQKANPFCQKSYDIPKIAKILKLFNITITSIMSSIHGDELLITFLYRDELIIIMKVAAQNYVVKYLLMYLSDGGPLGRVLRLQQDRTKLTDFILKIFKSNLRGNKSPSLMESLQFLCSSYESYKEMFFMLQRLRFQDFIQAFEMEKEGEIMIKFSPKMYHFVDYSFRVKIGGVSWTAFGVEIHIDEKILIIFKDQFDEIKKTFHKNLIQCLKHPILEVPKKLEATIKQLNLIQVFSAKDTLKKRSS